MDATNPIRRWMRLVGLLPIIAGCTSTPTEPGYRKPVSELRAQNAADYAAKQAQTAPTVARPQMPSEPAGPLAPLPPANVPPFESKPIVSGSPVVGLPVSNDPVAPTTAVQTGFTGARFQKPRCNFCVTTKHLPCLVQPSARPRPALGATQHRP